MAEGGEKRGPKGPKKEELDAKTPMDGSPPVQDLSEITGQHEQPEGRWRGERGAKKKPKPPAKPPPVARPPSPAFPDLNDTNPRFAVPDEITDAGIALGENDVVDSRRAAPGGPAAPGPAPAAPVLKDFAADERFAPREMRAPKDNLGPPAPVPEPQAPAGPSRVSDRAPPRVRAPMPSEAFPPDPFNTKGMFGVDSMAPLPPLPMFRPELATAGDDLLGAAFEDGNDNEAFERHLARYIEDFDDDENRVALELMADKLGRWSEIVVEAKRHLARLTGTTGEDRIWAHLSLWNERARSDRDGPPTSRSGEMQLAPPGPDLFGAEYTSFSAAPTFDPPPLGEALFQWPPPAPMTDAHLEEIEADPESAEPSSEEISEVSEVSEVSVVSEAAPRSVEIDTEAADSEPQPESIELVPDSSTGNLSVKSDTEPPMTDAQPPPTEAGGGMHFPPQSARTMFGGFTTSDRAEDSRTIFMPNAPVPPATDSELPLDAEDLIEELDENDVQDDAAARGSRSNEIADPRRSAVSLKNDPAVAERRAERESRLAQLRAEQEARAKERRGASAGPPPAPPVASAKATTTPTPEPVLLKPTGIDPTVLKTGEFDAALEKAVTDEERARILLERGRRDQKKGRTESAINSFRDVLTFEPNSLEAMEALATLYREVGNTARLVETLEQKLELAKTDPQRVEVLVALADVYENVLDDVPEAITRLERAHALAPRQTIPLQALARCHEKAGKFAAALEDLRKLMKGETSRSEKLELLLQIAGLQENKLDDPEGAVRTFEQIVAEHPQYKGAFDDLARLAEKSGSWRARAKLVEHQVELAKEPKRQAQLLVELGDLLAVADRDPEAAKKHYERAAKVFPSYPASWRGLEQLSTWAGDQKRAEFYLEQRVRHTSDLGERARVLIELAQYRGVVLNKQLEAIAAFEAAHKADPTNETAALALLGPFVGQKRFAEAAVLCDVLYRAALKADDRPRMLEILETSWQVATSMGNRGQLLAVAAARFRLAPDNTRFREAFLDTASGARENEEALKRIRSALDLALERTGDDLQTLSVLGDLFRGAGDLTTAESCFERVLLGNPVDPRALAFLSQRAEDRNDFRRAAALKERLARETRDNEKRFDLLLCAGDLWLRAKQQVGAALRAYEEALEIKPNDQLLLRTLHGLYVDQEQWERAAPVQRALADLEVDPERKGKLLTSLAQMLEEQLDDVAAAADVLEEVLETDATRLDAFERLVRILTRQKDWIGLANGYRQMIGKLDEKKDPKLAFALNHQLGLVYRDRVGDAERALKAFTHAASLRPDDLEARKIVTELLVVTQRLDAAVDVARATLKKDPLDQQLYRDLYELFLRAHAYDKAWCVAEAMSVHGPLTDTERQFVEDYPPVSPGEIPASLLATAWPTHIHHADLDRTLSSALQIAVAVYLRARLQQAAPPPLGIPLEQDASPESARVLAAFRNAAEVLACTMPALHGTPVPGPLFTTVLAHHPTITISLATSSTVADDLLNYLATKRLAEQQPALRARSLFPSVQELKQLFFTTTQLATTGPGNMMRPGWDGGLGAVMTPDERAALRGLVAGVASSGQKLDVKRWLQLAEVTAMRAGLLICGSVLTAQRAMGLEPRMPDDLGAQAWLAELGLYATSEQYFELRETIHVAI